ncbi:PDZ domain-containing protein [Haloferula sargassicola]
MQSLKSEDYPERVAGQRRLRSWMESHGRDGLESLRRAVSDSTDPEVRSMITEVLRSEVLDALDRKGPGFLGIAMGPAEEGVRVGAITAGMPAEKVGIQVGDIILAVNDIALADADPPSQFRRLVGGKKPGDEVVFQVRRGADTLEIRAILAPRPLSTPLPNGNIDPDLEAAAREAKFREWMEMRGNEKIPDSRR